MSLTHGAAARSWIIAGAMLVIGACGQADDPQVGADTTGNPVEVVYHRGNAAEPDTLDPHLAQGSWEDNIIGDMLIGLTTENASGEAIPGAATSWETSEDGLTWTFHLREHQWSDETPVTADDFVFSFRRILDPATASTYAYYLYPILNAQAVNAGELPTTELGVESADERTLVVHLENPAPYLAEFMTHASTFPVPRHVVDELGNEWTRPGNYVANGPYTLVDWIPNDHIELVKNPYFYDAENVNIDRVFLYPSSDYAAALQRFRAGELDVQNALPTVQIDWIRQNIPETIDLQPTLIVEYITVNSAREGLDDVRVREALSLALDRETIINQIIRLGNPPAYSMIPPGIANYPEGIELPYAHTPQAERLERARDLMMEAGYGPDNRLSIGLAVRSASSDARRVPAAIQQMWREIFVDVEIEQSDAAVFYALMQEHDFDTGIAGWVADFNDASNFLDLLRSGNSNNYGQYSNSEYDSLLDEAEAESDLELRGQIMARAEEIALRDHAWIPMFFHVTTSLVQTYVEDWTNNINDKNRTRWLSIDTEARAAMFPNRF
jgi:oligopeptide transport system substrate-binding protein